MIINLRSCIYIKIQLTDDGQNLSVKNQVRLKDGKHEVNRVIHKLRRFLLKNLRQLTF